MRTANYPDWFLCAYPFPLPPPPPPLPPPPAILLLQSITIQVIPGGNASHFCCGDTWFDVSQDMQTTLMEAFHSF